MSAGDLNAERTAGSKSRALTGRSGPADRPERTDRPQQRPVQGGYQPKPAARAMESAAPSVRDQGKGRSQKPQTRDEERKAPKNKKTIMKENTRAAGSWDDDAPMSRKPEAQAAGVT